MAERVVLDASAALALLRGEDEAAAVRDALAGLPPEPDAIVVTEHFWLEIVNVLVRRYRWEPGAVVRALRELDELGVETLPTERPLTLLALDRMVTSGLTAYDAAYLALAETSDARLLTLDGRLAEAAGSRAMPLLGRSDRKLGEGPATYQGSGDVAGVPWATFGGYLAELRQRP